MDELKAAILENLASRGVTNTIKAQLHKEIHGVLHKQDLPRPRPPPDALLIDDLIREYLAFTGYRHALAAFNVETGYDDENPQHTRAVQSATLTRDMLSQAAADRQHATALPRKFLSEELDIPDTATSRAVPLLYSLVVNAKASKAARSKDDEEEGAATLGRPGRPSSAAASRSAVEDSYGEDTFASESSVPGRPVGMARSSAKNVSNSTVGITARTPFTPSTTPAADLTLRWKDGVWSGPSTAKPASTAASTLRPGGAASTSTIFGQPTAPRDPIIVFGQGAR